MSKLVAVFQIGSLGDSIVSIPTLLSIRDLVPGCSEYLLVSRVQSRKVVPGDIFEMAWKPKQQLLYTGPEKRFQQLLSVPAVLAKLRYYNPVCCVSLMPADREPERLERDKKFFRAGGVKELIGFEPLPRSLFEPNDDISVQETEAYQRLQRIWGDAAPETFAKHTRMPILHPSPEANQRVQKWLTSNRKHPEKRLVALSAYSNFPSRDIPDETLLRLLPQLSKEGDAEVVMVGGPKDSERAAKLIAAAATGLNACVGFGVQESAAVLKAANLAICTESGPMHLASAVGVPLLATFSRINPQLSRWLPFAQGSNILYRDVPCAGCFSFNCPVAGHPCMQELAAEHILTAALNMLNGLPIPKGALNGTRVLTW